MYWSLVIGLGILPHFAFTSCTCGYWMTDPQREDNPVRFTDLVETNFASMKEFSGTPDWVKQQFNVSDQAGRGKFGKSFLPENVFLWSEADGLQGSAQYQRSLALRVGHQITSSNSITAAEVDTRRMDMFWGSYRATMKLSHVAGTCAAFFWVSIISSPRTQENVAMHSYLGSKD